MTHSITSDTINLYEYGRQNTGKDEKKSKRLENLAVARKYNLLSRAEGGSHHVFGFPGIKDSVSIPAHKPIKPVYIKQFVELIDKVKE